MQKARMPLLNKIRSIMPKLKQKQLPKSQKPKLRLKKVKKQLKRLNSIQKTETMREKRSRIPDRAWKLQPREISVEISLWNRGEERTDDNGSSREGGKDWRFDIQRECRWNGRKDQKIQVNMGINEERRIHKYWILSEIQRLEQLIKTCGKQNDNPIQRNIRREESLSKNVERRVGLRNSSTYSRKLSEMVELHIPNKETQWNMEKDSGCEQVEQGDREITFQDAGTRGNTIPSKLNGLCNIARPQISISPHHSFSKLNIIPSFQFQQQQLRIQSNTIWDQTQPNLLRRSNRINSQIDKNTFGNQNSKLLLQYTSNLSEQINSQNANNGSNENIGTVRMDNFNRQMRNRTEISNNISGMDMESEGDEYKNVGREKNKDDISVKGFAQRKTQQQLREDNITSSADRQIEFPETPDKKSVSVSNRTRQSQNASVKDKFMEQNNDSKQVSNQGIEMMDEENWGQPTGIINQQDNNMHVNNRRIATGLGSNTDIREPDRTYTTRLLERKGSGNDKQCQRNKSYLLRATPFRASLQEDARSGSLDTFRQHNSSLRYWELESEGIPDRKNKASIFSGEETQTTNHNNPYPRKTELNNRFTLVTMQIVRLLTEGRNDLNDLQNMQLHAIDRHIRNTVLQTNQQLCNSGSQRPGYTLPQRIQLQNKQSQTIHPPTNTSVKQSTIENEIGQSTGNSNSTDLAGTIVVHQTKEFIHQIPFPWISRQDSGDETENERQRSKASTRQCGRLPSGPVADVGRDQLMRCMKM
ncbi:MAG: hypothetical protein EZS28_014871 [Streblomastix strix]|uniref:Uncharacterized protein n=1 Tax=Streblomastix strix TaxID=222440 RepID=A0A5J4W4K7_9EUKA|nr:MAG: hypothetical protein EZS28_014871 [Streblomastix strix]